jgi:RimJ/RimL family protein N-acetyltransferase
MQTLYNDNRVQPWLNVGYVVPVGSGKWGWDQMQAESEKDVLARFTIMLKPKPNESGSEGKGNDEGEFVGFITVRWTSGENRECNLGIGISPQYWSSGYGTEAMVFVVDYCFRAFATHRVALAVFEGNEKAVKVYEKLYVTSVEYECCNHLTFMSRGFVEEGRKRKFNWVDGKWKDVILMSILEDEFWAKERSKNAHSS